MKIVCDNCATKYSIADEKVRGKVFKIRCKKCSHIIVVRGGADGNAEASRDAGPSADAGFPGEDQATMAAGAAPMRGTPAGGVAATGDAVWHLVIDREQVGPLTPAEVRTKFSNGEIDVETYAWREGFGDWLRLGSIEDFRDLGAPAGDENATRRTDSADLFAGAGGGDDSAPNDQPAGDLFGGAAASPAFSSAPAPAAASAEADVFGGGGGGLFGAPSAAPAPRPSRTSSPGFAASAAAAAPVGDSAGGVDVRPMTGQRNENSVLFSLNNLQALATGGGGAKASSAPEPRPGFANSQTEGSGLIDIRAMAASTLAASPSTSSGPSGSKDDLPGLGNAPVFSPMAAPILMPAAPSGPPKWMWGILGVGVLAVLGIVVVGILLLTRKPEPTVVAAAPGTAPAATAPAAAPTAAAPAAAAPAAAAPAAGTPAAVAQNDKAAASEEKKHGKDKGAKAAADKGTKVAKAEPAAKASAPVAAEAPAAPAPKKSGGKHDALDDLLNDASPESKPAASSKHAAREESSGSDESLPDTLDKGQVVAGMGKVKSNVTACYDQYHVPGMAMVALTISPSGKVSSANVTGQFAGTPTGECVAKAVKKASFPRFKGAPMPINYPYVLR